MYVCVCVCVCVFILFHLLVSSGCTASVICVRCSDQRYFVVSTISGFSIPISESIMFHPQRRKPQPTATGEKANDIELDRRRDDRMIYIDIGYKSAQRPKPTVAERY